VVANNLAYVKKPLREMLSAMQPVKREVHS